MEVSLKQLAQDVTASGLVSIDDFAAFQRELPAAERPADAADLAKKLIRAGKLTKYQAANALQGKAKNLVFGEYVVLDRIGAGGMGQVYKAEHRRMKRVVALKILPPSAVKSPDAVLRFQREVQSAARLEHPNIVAAFDAGEGNGVHFLVMQYVEGKDLSSLVKERGPLPVADAVDYVMQAARGLAYAHGKGMVHRDIKPANLLLDQTGVVKVLDMGLARFDDAEAKRVDAGLTRAGQVMGTVDFMAPEQAENTHQADHRADIYSLGCMFYQLLTGANPYVGDTAVKSILAHREQPIPSLRAKRREISEALDQVFRRMVAKRPDDRFQSMSEVLAALGACQPVKNPPSGKTALPPLTVGAAPADTIPGGNQSTEAFVMADAGSKAAATLIDSAAVKKTWGMTAKVIGGTFGTIIAPILVALVLKYIDTPDPPKPAAEASATAVAPDKSAALKTPAAEPSASPMPPKVAPAPSPVLPALPIKVTDGKPLDLLGIVDPARDAIGGNWEKHGGALQLRASSSKAMARLQLPVEVSGEYDVVLMVSRPKPAPPANGLMLAFPIDGRQGMVVMDGFRTRGWAIQRVDDKVSNTENGTLVVDKQEITASTSHIVVKVRRGGVAVTCNDELILDWRGRAEQLSLPQNFVLPNTQAMALFGHTDFNIHQLTVVPGGGDWTPLFNGRDLKGWTTTDKDRWKVDADSAVLVGYGISGKHVANWLLSDREYRDFRLRLEFQLASQSNGGLALRSEADTADVDQLEIQLVDDVNIGKRLATGSIRNLPSGKEKNTLPAVPPELKPAGSWNEVEVELRGRSLRMWINGRQIQDVELKESPSEPPKKGTGKGSKKAGAEAARVVPGLRQDHGRIGLQILVGQVRYRNIVIHELK